MISRDSPQKSSMKKDTPTYINATESVIKLLKIIKENSPFRQVCQREKSVENRRIPIQPPSNVSPHTKKALTNQSFINNILRKGSKFKDRKRMGQGLRLNDFETRRLYAPKSLIKKNSSNFCLKPVNGNVDTTVERIRTIGSSNYVKSRIIDTITIQNELVLPVIRSQRAKTIETGEHEFQVQLPPEYTLQPSPVNRIARHQTVISGRDIEARIKQLRCKNYEPNQQMFEDPLNERTYEIAESRRRNKTEHEQYVMNYQLKNSKYNEIMRQIKKARRSKQNNIIEQEQPENYTTPWDPSKMATPYFRTIDFQQYRARHRPEQLDRHHYPPSERHSPLKNMRRSPKERQDLKGNAICVPRPEYEGWQFEKSGHEWGFTISDLAGSSIQNKHKEQKEKKAAGQPASRQELAPC